MRWTKMFAVLVLLFGPCCFGQASPSAPTEKPATQGPEFSIVVAPPEGPVRLGSPITVTFTVTNISGKKIAWECQRIGNRAYKEYSYLLMKDGREVETTVYHRKITGRQRPDDPLEIERRSSISLPFPPGVMFVITVDLSRLYEIKEPGVYTLDIRAFP